MISYLILKITELFVREIFIYFKCPWAFISMTNIAMTAFATAKIKSGTISLKDPTFVVITSTIESIIEITMHTSIFLHSKDDEDDR